MAWQRKVLRVTVTNARPAHVVGTTWPGRRPPRDRETPVRVALKLYASLADHLPPEARRTNRLDLELAPETTIADVIRQQNLPPKMCHLVLVNGHYVAPGTVPRARSGRTTSSRSGRRSRVAETEVLALAQDMTISRESFLRALPAAVDHAPFAIEGAEIRPVDAGLGWRIVVTPLPELPSGLIVLPRHRVEIHLNGFDQARTRAFLQRFELYFRRAGG